MKSVAHTVTVVGLMWVTRHFGRGCKQRRFRRNDWSMWSEIWVSVSKEVRITHQGHEPLLINWFQLVWVSLKPDSSQNFPEFPAGINFISPIYTNIKFPNLFFPFIFRLSKQTSNMFNPKWTMFIFSYQHEKQTVYKPQLSYHSGNYFQDSIRVSYWNKSVKNR